MAEYSTCLRFGSLNIHFDVPCSQFAAFVWTNTCDTEPFEAPFGYTASMYHWKIVYTIHNAKVTVIHLHSFSISWPVCKTFSSSPENLRTLSEIFTKRLKPSGDLSSSLVEMFWQKSFALVLDSTSNACRIFTNTLDRSRYSDVFVAWFDSLPCSDSLTATITTDQPWADNQVIITPSPSPQNTCRLD